jgi:hypothetical protein
MACCNEGGKIGRASGSFRPVTAVGQGGPLSNQRGAGAPSVMRRAGAVVFRGNETFFAGGVGTGIDRSLSKSLIDRFPEPLAFPLLGPSVFVSLVFVFSTDLFKTLQIGEDIFSDSNWGVMVLSDKRELGTSVNRISITQADPGLRGRLGSKRRYEQLQCEHLRW